MFTEKARAKESKTSKGTKKPAAKKPAASKSTGKKVVKKTVTRKTTKPKASATEIKLAAELKNLIPQLDAEGLAFLVEQARIHLYNMQVDKLNEAAIAAESATARTREVARSEKQTRAAKPAHIRIDGTDSGSSYYLYYGNTDIMFTREEMIQLVKIVHGEGTDLEIQERLYNWFNRERKDVFAGLPMQDKFDDNLKILATYLKKNFKIRK